MQETYLGHPTFGLLYSLCSLGDKQGLFTTLYTQRLFFRVSSISDEKGVGEDLVFDPVSRNEARQLLDEQIRILRRTNRKADLEHLQKIYQQTFV